MKVLETKEQALKEVTKQLKRKRRYNNTLDTALFEEVWNNRSTPVLIKGIGVAENETVDVNGTECTLYVLYNPFAVLLLGCRVALSVSDTVNQIVMFVDDDYMQMSDNTKVFTKYHELAHIILNHYHGIGSERNIEYEYAADMYASKYANAITALSEINNYLKDAEITNRINKVNSSWFTTNEQLQEFIDGADKMIEQTKGMSVSLRAPIHAGQYTHRPPREVMVIPTPTIE